MVRMDPFAPIHGITLERYAELGAKLDGVTDRNAQKAKVAEEGISGEVWDAVVDGWTARMQDPSNMGQVASRYMQALNAAQAQTHGNVHCSFEDWVAVQTAIGVFGWEAAMNHYDVTQGQWTTISSHWQTELSRDPMNLGQRRNQLQEQEAARLRGGGQPKPVQFTQGPAGAAPAGGGAGLDPQASGQMMAAAGAQNAQQWQAYSAGVLNQAGVQGAMGMMGMMNKLGGGDGLVAGRAVKVQWSDGNHYPATITQDGGQQAQITFPNGQTMWVEKQYLSPA